MRKCNNMQIRSDLADCGIYVFSHSFYRLMLYLQQEIDYQWIEVTADFLPYLVKN